MSSNRGRLPPTGFHNFFSFGAGVVAVHQVHQHQVELLALSQAIWLLSLVFIQARAKRAGGMFLEWELAWYYGFSISFYVVGILFEACFYAVYG